MNTFFIAFRSLKQFEYFKLCAFASKNDSILSIRDLPLKQNRDYTGRSSVDPFNSLMVRIRKSTAINHILTFLIPISLFERFQNQFLV